MTSAVAILALVGALAGCATTAETKRTHEPARPAPKPAPVVPPPVAPSAPVTEKAPPAPVAPVESRSRQALAAGLADYSNGSYPAAQKNFQAALDLGLEIRDQIKARKHLAFIHCVSGKTRLCHDEFAKALKLDPTLVLEPAEAGHPIWGPVFKAEKAKLGKKTPAKKK